MHNVKRSFQVFGKLISERKVGQFHHYCLHASNQFGFQGYAEHPASIPRCFSMFTVYVLNKCRIPVWVTGHLTAQIVFT